MTSSSGLGDLDSFDPLKEARAYNTSILFMLSVPYIILAVAGLAIFRAVRRQRVLAQAKAERCDPSGVVLPTS
jgi:hypothetical protein